MADLIASTPSLSHPLLPGVSLGGAVDLGSEGPCVSATVCASVGAGAGRWAPGRDASYYGERRNHKGEMWLLSSS